jgi:hypothetical protein
MNAIGSRKIDPAKPRLLTKFPDAYEKLITSARDADSETARTEAPLICQNLISELLKLSINMEVHQTDPSIKDSIVKG